ncbi:hypothetical protein B0H13DRAFT_2308674 [Mycena leptocephala]|nr:hypothetical protein B0H13DRAFT_2308674 [Mycena leptocephala]
MLKSVLVTTALAIGAAAQALTINTPVPGAAECQPFLITWANGVPPYFVTCVHVQNNPPSGTPVVDFGQQTGTQLTWLVNQTLGTSLIFQIKDNTGLTASSAPFTITAGSDSCIGAGGGGGTPGSSTSGTTPTGPASSPGATGASTPANTGPTTGGSTTKASGSTSSAKTSGSATTSSSAGQAVAVPAGVFPAFVAVLGAGLIAVLA